MQFIKLGQLHFQKKSKRKAGEGQNSGSYKFFTSSQVQKKYVNEYDFSGPALIFGTGGSANIHYCDEQFSTSTDCFILKTEDDQIDLKYVSYFLRGNISLLENGFKGAGLEHISKEYLSEIQIPLPSLEVQKSIVAKLDKLTKLIDLKKEAIGKTEELTKSVFLEMFGDPYKNEKNWEIEKLENIVAPGKIVTYGIVQAGPNIEGGIPYIRTGDIKNNQIIIENLLKTSPEIARSYRRSEVSYGDIIMSIRATVGTVALLPKELHGANLTQGTARISPGPKVDRLFLFFLIQTKSVQDWLERSTKGATFKEITLTRLRELPMIIPPLDLQKKFSEIIQKNQTITSDQKQSLQKIQELYDATVQEVFSF